MKQSNWIECEVCIKCEIELSLHTIASNTVCPNCGNISKSQWTIDTITSAKKFHYTKIFPAYIFWRKNQGYWKYEIASLSENCR